jgi:hypothetical protein
MHRDSVSNARKSRITAFRHDSEFQRERGSGCNSAMKFRGMTTKVLRVVFVFLIVIKDPTYLSAYHLSFSLLAYTELHLKTLQSTTNRRITVI